MLFYCTFFLFFFSFFFINTVLKYFLKINYHYNLFLSFDFIISVYIFFTY